MNSQSFRSSVLLVALALGAAVLPSSLTAQQDSTVVIVAPTPAVAVALPLVSVTPSLADGPRISPSGITKPKAADTRELSLRQESMGNGRNVAMMLVGVAGIVVGSIVGGDGGNIIAISGGVIGLIGLFRYVQ
jgi:hypothetical protein